MMAIELCKDGDLRRPDPELTRDVLAECFESGLVALSSGVHANAIRLLSPLYISNDDLDEGLSILPVELVLRAS
jgi:4-aminobutyrate aminotransferase/(S)-3-amino-2-methylpropionate transaminase